MPVEFLHPLQKVCECNVQGSFIILQSMVFIEIQWYKSVFCNIRILGYAFPLHTLKNKDMTSWIQLRIFIIYFQLLLYKQYQKILMECVRPFISMKVCEYCSVFVQSSQIYTLSVIILISYILDASLYNLSKWNS